MLKIQKRQLPLHIMLLPAVVMLFVFNYIPLAGIAMAFENFIPSKGIFGSPFVGFDNFRYVFGAPNFLQVVWNTLFIAILKIVTGLVVPVIFSILLNEIKNATYKKSVQTLIYLPHFLSWVILGGILTNVLSPSTGIVNIFLKSIGFKPILFLGSASIFPYVIVSTNIWKEFGFGTIVYLAAITGIDPSLYESSTIDGANRLKQTVHITIPGMLPIIILMATLSLGNILNAGFDQIFNLYSPIVYSTGDIIDTFVYRMGLVDMQYGVATAIGLFKSVISLILIGASYKLAYKYGDYRIF